MQATAGDTIDGTSGIAVASRHTLAFAHGQASSGDARTPGRGLCDLEVACATVALPFHRVDRAVVEILSLLPLALITLLAAGYAHACLPELSTSATSLLIARILLIGTGIGFGVATIAFGAIMAGGIGVVAALLAFLAGFGVVHVPAALIMALKRWRRREGAGPQQPEDWP